MHLAETIQFTSIQLKQWLEKETNSTLTPVQTQAKKQRDEMSKSLESLNEVCQQILESSSSEIEKRNMKVYNRARALNKLARLFLDRLEKLRAPEQVTYDSLNKFASETQKTLVVTEIDVKNWFPRISPFFIMDRRKFLTFYEKTKQSFNTLNDFVNKEYVKTKTLEETFQSINELQNLEKNSFEVKNELEKIKNERVPIEQEIAGLQQKTDELKSKGPIDRLNAINGQIEIINNDLKHAIRHLQKPFVKMQSLATSGGGAGITPDELKELNMYLESPFEALVKEDKGYPILKQILQKLDSLLKEDKLKLKPEKARKAEQSIIEINVKNALIGLQENGIKVYSEKSVLVNSTHLDETKRNISAFQEQAEALKARKTSVEAHETIKEREYKDLQEKISNNKRAIERSVLAALNKKIQLL